MTTETKPLAKSLRTVTVLVRTCRMLEGRGMNRQEFTDSERMDEALHWLGLADKPDTYGLAGLALVQLETGK